MDRWAVSLVREDPALLLLMAMLMLKFSLVVMLYLLLVMLVMLVKDSSSLCVAGMVRVLASRGSCSDGLEVAGAVLPPLTGNGPVAGGGTCGVETSYSNILYLL